VVMLTKSINQINHGSGFSFSWLAQLLGTTGYGSGRNNPCCGDSFPNQHACCMPPCVVFSNQPLGTHGSNNLRHDIEYNTPWYDVPPSHQVQYILNNCCTYPSSEYVSLRCMFHPSRNRGGVSGSTEPAYLSAFDNSNNFDQLTVDCVLCTVTAINCSK
jgi:hypothetical protein